MKMDNSIRSNSRKANTRELLQDLGLFLFLTGIFCSAAVLAFSSSEQRFENIVMLFILFGEIILAAYKFRYLAIIIGGCHTCFYAIFKIYQGLFLDISISLFSYTWLVLPMFCILSMVWFMKGTYETEIMMEMLEKQIEEQIVTDQVTGLYNLKSMYIDLERQLAYSRRNNLPISLMIVDLRYEQELRSIMSTSQFERFRQIYTQILEDALRLEDKIYAIDEKGTVGIICFCNREGAEIIKRRIVANLSSTDQFRVILDRSIRVDIRVGIYEYDKDKVENSIDLKKKAENELQYDI